MSGEKINKSDFKLEKKKCKFYCWSNNLKATYMLQDHKSKSEYKSVALEQGAENQIGLTPIKDKKTNLDSRVRSSKAN